MDAVRQGKVGFGYAGVKNSQHYVLQANDQAHLPQRSGITVEWSTILVVSTFSPSKIIEQKTCASEAHTKSIN